MKQIYYVIQTLLRGRGSNIIKIISLGVSLTMSILLFSRVAYEQSFDTCYKDYDNLYQIWSVFTVKGEKYPPQEQNCGPVAGAILENFPEQVEAVLNRRYRETGKARVFTITDAALRELLGSTAPYTPPDLPFYTSEGSVLDVPPLKAP